MKDSAASPGRRGPAPLAVVRRRFLIGVCGRVLSEGELFERILGFYRARGTDATSPRAVVLMRVETASRLISPVYDTGASEPEVVANWRAHHLNIHPPPCVRGPAPAPHPKPLAALPCRPP